MSSISIKAPGRALELFYSYSQKDERLFKELEIHLKQLEDQGHIAGWHSCLISPGTDWRSKIRAHIHSADIILLLVSADFFVSDYYKSVELKQAIEERHFTGKARIIPIILRECSWEGTIIERLQPLPLTRKPVTLWSHRDSAWKQITQGIRQVVEELTTAASLPSHEAKLENEQKNSPVARMEQQHKLLNLRIEQEHQRQDRYGFTGHPSLKIDKDIIVRYDLDMQMNEFSKRLNFGGAYPFLLGGQDNVLRDYIIERMCRELKNKLGRAHRKIDIRLVREDVPDSKSVIRKKILARSNQYKTLVDLFKEDRETDVVLTIWNYFFPPEALKVAAHYFWEEVVAEALPFLEHETGQCFIIILANVGEKEFIYPLDYFTLLHVPDQFEMPRFTKWVRGWLQRQGLKSSTIEACIDRLEANHGHFLATYQEIESIISDFQGGNQR